ncbi:hypothetical protein QE152_g13458 [Popillia japonica]|uniref:Zinc finger PHD-type domain-containing protein n=1 Tax=Popillia japonica TaxID=7064 RepID=A0AAW1L9T7_POPJA
MSKHVENSLAAKQQIMDTSFTELLPTPKIKTSANPRRKAINSSAVIVTKDLFGPKMKCNPSPMPKERSIKTKRPGGSENGKSRVQKESWYCFVCNTDTVLDMRRWAACGNYVHEECVDLTKDDTQSFLCPRMVRTYKRKSERADINENNKSIFGFRMVRTYKRKSERADINENNVSEAIGEMHNGMSIRVAAAKSNLKKSILHKRLKNFNRVESDLSEV